MNRKFERIDEIVHETKRLTGPYGNRIQIDYDLSEDRLYCEEFVDATSYIMYNNPDVIHVATVCRPLSKPELIDMITQAIEDHRKY